MTEAAGARVESAGPEVTEQLVALSRRCGDVGWSPAGFRTELEHAGGRCWVARGPRGAGGAVLGYVLCRRVLDEVHVHALAVAPEARRRGIARALLARALASEAAAGAASAHLEVRAGALAARRCYAAVGFAVVGRRARYYPGGEDALLMTCESLPGAARDGAGGERPGAHGGARP